MKVTRRNFLRTIGFGSAILSLTKTGRAENTISTRPNIVFILADDLGYGDLGCYGQKKIKTPFIDRMAKEGTRFTQAYAGSTVCAPSRCCLMTGKHNGHTRVRDNIPHGIFLQPDDFTIAEMLKQAGYATCAIGKWSLGNPGSWGVANYQGFDEFYGHLNQDQAHFYYPDYLWHNNKVELLFGNRGGKKNDYTQDLFTDHAIDFINKNQQNPFFLYLAYTIPHYSDYNKNTPEHYIVPTDEPYSQKTWPQVEKNYAAMVSRLDKDVGRVLDTLKSVGLDNNTLVIFTSDNGPCEVGIHDTTFFTSSGPFRGVKRDMYEGGIRVPMIMRWPDRVQTDATSDQVMAFWDMMPTIAELVGLPKPKNSDGISMLPAIMGEKQKENHDYLYWDYGHVRDSFKQAVRMGDWKGVRNGVETPVELYNLKDDPAETKDVAKLHPDIVKKIESLFQEAFVPDKNYPVPGLTANK